MASAKKRRRPRDIERARSGESPGAHSGRERQAQERIVRGTASAREGYPAEGGTADGRQLEGVEADRENDKNDKE